MASQQDAKTPQASVSTDLSADTIQTGPHNVDNSSHVGGSDNPVPVLFELLRQVPSLSSEEPEAILQLIKRLEEIYALGLTDDRMFVIRILPLVSGAVLRFFGDCLSYGRNWEQCMGTVDSVIFPFSSC